MPGEERAHVVAHRGHRLGRVDRADQLHPVLGLLTGHRIDLVADRTRTINRLRPVLTSMFPALERALELTNAGPLVLLSGYQTPTALRRIGTSRLTTWLRNRKVRGAENLAKAAVEAAERQHTAVVGETVIAKMVHTLAKEVMALNEKIAEIDKLTEGRFREHELAEVILSMPGMGPKLGAEFLVAVGGRLDGFPTADRLAAFGGVAPAPHDSGKTSGYLRRPQRYHRRLQRVFYTSALVSAWSDPNSKRFYDRKRAEGKATSRPYSRWPGDASTSCGHSSATDGATKSCLQQRHAERSSCV